MINRINLILRAKNITARQFAEEIGIQPSGMSHILGGRNNPSLDFVAKVLRRYPEIDANWLLLGKGEMYTSGSKISPSAMESVMPIEEPLSERRETPSLFDEEPSEVPSQPVSIQASVPQHDAVVDEVREKVAVPYETNPEPQIQPSQETRCIDRILLIYSDNTYKELRPQA